MRLPSTLPKRTMAEVVIAFSTILVAVPAFMRVEPVTTSGPVSGAITTSWVSASSGGGCVQRRNPVRAPRSRARSRAPCTKGVVPEAAIPITKSSAPTSRSSMAAAPSPGWSSAPSCARTRAACPPAITPCTMAGSVP